MEGFLQPALVCARDALRLGAFTGTPAPCLQTLLLLVSFPHQQPGSEPVKRVGGQLVAVAEVCSPRNVSAGFISETLGSSPALLSKPRPVAQFGFNVECV